MNETKNDLPSSYSLIRGNYVGGPNTCQQTKRCKSLKMTKGVIVKLKM
jgi:hypothetical protein